LPTAHGTHGLSRAMEKPPWAQAGGSAVDTPVPEQPPSAGVLLAAGRGLDETLGGEASP
jgi:hypothetical protein